MLWGDALREGARGRGALDDAREAYRRVLLLLGPGRHHGAAARIDAHLGLAATALRIGDLDRAAAHASGALSEAPSTGPAAARAALLLGEAQLRRGRFGDAGESYQQAIDRSGAAGANPGADDAAVVDRAR
ncbi:MAG: hypothetical protein AAF772_21595, partial [Acidobacteriota bacterium]